MKKILILGILAPTAAFAHAGNHSGGVAKSIAHALTEPVHLMAALGAIALGYAAYRLVKG